MGNRGSIFQDNPQLQKKKLKFDGETLKYAACHMKGWRQYMEDACIYLNNFPQKNHYLFGVFDGHGGPQIAQYVQKHFSMQLTLNQHFQTKQYPQALLQTFNKMDELIKSEAGKKEILSIINFNVKISNRSQEISGTQIGGCTANVCFITDKDVYVANAGDSRCVACCKGRMIPLSFDHKPQDKAEYRRIKKAGGFVKGGRINQALNMSRSLGDLQFKNNKTLGPSEQIVTSTPDLISCRRQGLDFIIIGCDGIWQKKSNKTMVEWIKARLDKKKEPIDILDELFDEQLKEDEQGCIGTDNMSAILIKFHS